MLTIARLQVRQMLGEHKIWALALLVALPALISLLLRVSGGIGPTISPEAPVIYLFMMYPQVMCELVALLYATTILSAELEAQTLSYLFTRPLARWRVIVGKYAAAVTVLGAIISLSLAGSWLLLGAPKGAQGLFGLWSGVCAALAAYSAVFLLVGIVVPARAMVIALVYALVEFALSFVPAVLNTLTVTYHLRSLVVQMVGIEVPPDLARVVGGASGTAACSALAAMVAGGLAAACWAASLGEYAAAKG